jgi:cation:H+ antiporter
MEALLHGWMGAQPLWLLLAIIVVFLVTLAKGADILVDQAVLLSTRWGVSPIVIGATIISLGTTLPEAAVSVAAALAGNPGLALGNAVGSIICDTGLILGLALLIGPIPLDKRIVNRQGWMQVGAVFLLIALCFPWLAPSLAFSTGSALPQWGGILLLVLLVVYLIWSVWFFRKLGPDPTVPLPEIESTGAAAAAITANPWWILLKLMLAIAVVVLSAQILIPAAQESAVRMNIPPSIIAATLVAFGTSLPELVTVISSVRKGQGGLALGNVIGADILNVLFVAGAAAAVTSGGLHAGPDFFKLLFPGMALLIIILRVAIMLSGKHLHRSTGFLLLGSYIIVTVLAFQY